MRSEKEVRSQFEELYQRRLAKRREEFLGKTHRNCEHNVRLRVKGHGMCGFCRHETVLERSPDRPFVCDEEGTAKNCPLFECRNTPESVEEDLIEILKSPSQAGEKYPKLAILKWVLMNQREKTRWGRIYNGLHTIFRTATYLILFKWW